MVKPEGRERGRRKAWSGREERTILRKVNGAGRVETKKEKDRK